MDFTNLGNKTQTINLSKNTGTISIDLTKRGKPLVEVYFGASWDPVMSGRSIDIDTTAIAVASDGKWHEASDVLFYNNLQNAYILIPACIFLFGAVISFSTGSSWGTFAMLMPLAIPMGHAFGISYAICLGAVLSGGLFGDHCSPLSDTTILSSMGAECNLVDHVRTQLPYEIGRAHV